MLCRSHNALGITKLGVGRLLWWHPLYPLYRSWVVSTTGLGILDRERPLASPERRRATHRKAYYCNWSIKWSYFILVYFRKGHAVAQFVEALRYKSGGRGFNSQCCHRNFSLTYFFRPHYGPGVDSASNRNEYQEYFLGGKGSRCIGLTTLPPPCADCLEIWEPQTPETLRACQGL